MLDYRYHTFMIVAQTQSFTRTAERLNLSQPSITAQIRSLEKELDCSLYTYDKRKFKLTDKGKAVYRYCCEVEQLNHALDQELTHVQQRPLIIVSTSIIGNYLVPKVVAPWLQNDPTINIEQHILSTPDCLAAIDNGQADCALIEGYVDAVVYPCQTIKTAKIVCCASPDHPLFHHGLNHINDLLKYPLIVKERHAKDRGIVPHALANHNLSYDSFINTITVGSISGMKQMLISNGGIGFLHEDAIENELKYGLLKEIDVVDFKLSHDMVMISNPNSLFEDQLDHLYNQVKSINGHTTE